MKLALALAAAMCIAGCAFFNPPDNRPGYRPWEGPPEPVPSWTNSVEVAR